MNKINNFIKIHKDKTEIECSSNVVYKIFCNNCDATYVGQTKRQLRTKAKEHINNIKLDPSKHSVITSHRIFFDHSFNWKEIKILDTEDNYQKRLISEMIYIKQQTNGLNSQSDTKLLHDSYFFARLSQRQHRYTLLTFAQRFCLTCAPSVSTTRSSADGERSYNYCVNSLSSKLFNLPLFYIL